MALTNEITYTLEDDSGDSATTGINVPTAFSLAQFTEFARAMAGFIDDIVSGLVARAELTVNIDLSALTGNTVGAGSDVQEINSYQFATAVGRPVSVNVPGTDETDVSAGSDELNQLDTQQAAFVNAMVNGIAVTGGTIQPSDIDSEDITAIVFARESARASGKRR